jgi:hypothetical protein
MKEALLSKLLGALGVTGLVGDRISWALRPRRDALPAIALHLISAPRDYHMAGPSGLVTSRVQVDCWAQSAANATAVSRAVNAAIGGMRETVDGVEFQGAFLETETDMTDDEGATPDEVLYRVSMDFFIWHSE